MPVMTGIYPAHRRNLKTKPRPGRCSVDHSVRHYFMSTMTKDKINVSLFDEVKKLQLDNAMLREAFRQNQHENIELRKMLLDASRLARCGKYTAIDFVEVGRRLDAMDAYLSLAK